MHAVLPARSDSSGAAADVLWWLARLPVVEEEQLQAILGVDRPAVAGALRDLGRRGLAAWLLMDSPEFAAPRRVHHLTEAGISALARAVGRTVAELEQELPVSRHELLTRITRVETALAVGRFIAALTADLRDDEDVSLLEARGSHWAHRQTASSGLPAVEAYVRLRVGEVSAGFGLVWDRAAAPAAHRRRRVAAWYRADEEQYHTGRMMPLVLVICPDEGTLGHWLAAVERSAARRARDRLPLTLATVRDVAAQGPLGACWRRPGGNRRVDLLDCLAWRTAPPAQVILPHCRVRLPEAIGDGSAHQLVGIGRPWDVKQARSGHRHVRRSRVERWAALRIRLSATQLRLLSWVAHHPLLPRTHLAMHLDLADRQIAPLLDDLVRQDLITIDMTRRPAEPEGPRYVLTADGAAFLSARDGVPPRLYLTEGVIAADVHTAGVRRGPGAGRSMAASVRLTHLRRNWEHTTGVQRFALALTREAQRRRQLGQKHRLLAWLNEAESQVWFRHDGRLQHIWPDGRFLYRADGVVHDLLLEWDRGLVRRRDYLRKLTAYAAYVAARVRAHDDRQRLLIVTTTAAEQRLRQVLDQVAAAVPALGRHAHVVLHQSVTEERIIADLLRSRRDKRTHQVGREPPWTGNY